jgi:ABC-type transporter Mla subunit MlaD
VPRLPGLPDVVALLRAQTEALAALPATVTSLQRSVIALGDTLEAGRETVQIVNRLALRLERLIDELEAPVLALAPGLSRAATLLDDPVVEALPDLIRRLQTEALPLLRAVSETQTRLMQLPGAALIGAMTGRRPDPAKPPGPER